MGNGCTFKGQSDAPVVDEDGNRERQQPKGKQIRVVLVDSDCTDSEVDEAVKRILKGGNPVGGKKKKNNDNDNSSAFDSSASEAPPSSAASPTSPVSEEPELIAKGVPIKKKKLLKMGKKGRKVGKQSKSKSGKSASKKKSMSTPLSSLASSANSSSVDSSSVNSSVQPPPPPPLIKQPAKVTRKEIIKSTGFPPAKTKTKNADSTFFSSPLRLPSDSEQEDSSTAEEKGKGKQLHLKENTQIQSSDDGGGSSDNANDAHTH